MKKTQTSTRNPTSYAAYPQSKLNFQQINLFIYLIFSIRLDSSK